MTVQRLRPLPGRHPELRMLHHILNALDVPFTIHINAREVAGAHVAKLSAKRSGRRS